MTLRLAFMELNRLATRPRYIVMFLSLALLGVGLIVFSTGGLYQAPDANGKWTAWSGLLQIALPINVLMPLFIGFITGASLAEDRATGYQQFMQLRTNSRTQFIIGKSAGMISASFIGAVGSFALLSAVTFMFLPGYPIDPNIASFNKELFGQSPYLYLGLIAIMIGLSASAMSGVACIASILIKNPYIVGSVPIGFLLSSTVLESIAKFKYFEIFTMLSIGSPEFTFSNLAFAWLLYILLFYGLTIFLFENKRVPIIKKGVRINE